MVEDKSVNKELMLHSLCNKGYVETEYLIRRVIAERGIFRQCEGCK